jgi:ATP-dependent protease ClpP protease subunit
MIKTILLLALLMAPRALALTIKSTSGKFDYKLARVAKIEGEIKKDSGHEFIESMIRTIAPGDRVILINSGGGLVDEGRVMIDTVRMERAFGTRIVCVVTKQASSMAFNFLTNCDVRLAVKKAHFLVHKVSFRMLDEKEQGRLTAKRLRQIAKQADEIDEPYRQANAKAMKLSLPEYDLMADQETIWNVDHLLTRGYLTDTVEILP